MKLWMLNPKHWPWVSNFYCDCCSRWRLEYVGAKPWCRKCQKYFTTYFPVTPAWPETPEKETR